MVTNENISSFIKTISPASKALQTTLQLLNEGDLVKAAKVAQTDSELVNYLKSIVNNPLYGFKNEISNISQIFGILGVASSQQTIYNYMVNVMSPKDWKLFALRKKDFHNLQAELSINWKRILTHLKVKNKDIESAITILPLSIIVVEALFNDKKEEVILLRSGNHLDFNTILQRVCKVDLFDICEMIAKKWGMNTQTREMIQASSGIKPSDKQAINLLSKWMHLLVFYQLSKEQYIKAGLNDFIDFQVDYVSDIYNEFITLMEIK